jgi:hypothetical protein
MPAREEIQNELNTAKTLAQDTIRRRYLRELSEFTKRNTLLYATAFSSNKLPGIPGYVISITQEDIQGFMAALHGVKGDTLDLVLHSPGGSLEAADQIVQYLRSKFRHIRAIVPQNAMSAATMIACACDEIVMGKHSAIGPIDPQITFPTQSGHFTAPAHAILAEFDQVRAEVIADPRTAPLWVNKINMYPAGFLNICRDTIKLAEDKVAEWLEANMLKGEQDAAAKARSAASWLNNAANHKTHGRPISAAQAGGIGLKIVALEDNQELQEKVLSLYHATVLTFETTNCMKMVENQYGKGWFVNLQVLPAVPVKQMGP